jgi:hypothetical protein
MNMILRPDGQPIVGMDLIPKNTGISITVSGNMTAESPYGYASNISLPATNAGFYKTEFVPDSGYGGGVRQVGHYPLHLDNTAELFEIMSFAAEARSLALGAIPNDIAGFSGKANVTNFWLNTLLAPDPFPGHNYSDHAYHSGEFRFDNMDQKGYWDALLENFGLKSKKALGP